MRKTLLTLSLSLLAVIPVLAQEPEKEPDIYDIVERETERLQTMLELEDWQVFYVDSTLMHNFPKMQEEMEKLQKARVGNSSIYISIQDKWMEATDRSYEKFFTPAQWEKYLKSGAARAQKQRDKRKGLAVETAKREKPAKKRK